MFKLIKLPCFILFVVAFNSSAQTDPTKPLWGSKVVQTNVKKTRLNLQSIMSNGHSAKAIINAKVLKVGERILSYKVTAIKAKSVKLSSADKNIELTLFSKAVVKKN